MIDWQWVMNVAVPAIGGYVVKLHADYSNLKDRVLMLESRTPSQAELAKGLDDLHDRCHEYELAKAKEAGALSQMQAQLVDHAAEIKAIGKSLHNINNSLVRIEAKLEVDQ